MAVRNYAPLQITNPAADPRLPVRNFDTLNGGVTRLLHAVYSGHSLPLYHGLSCGSLSGNCQFLSVYKYLSLDGKYLR